MSEIRAQIDAKLRTARLERDDATKNVIGMLKSKVLNELKAAKDTEETDELWKRVIASYAKQLQKTIAELERAGERADDARKEAEWELAFCQAFLPRKLDEAATEALVRKLATEHEVTSLREQGKLMGLIMKHHRDEIDGNLARQIVQRVLE